MSPVLNLRTSVVYVLICSLILSGVFTVTTNQSHASNKSLRHSLTPTVNESAEKTGPQAATVDEATRSRVHETLGKLPLSFEENRGQVDSEVKYVSRGSGYTLFLTETEAVLTLRKADKVGRHEKQAHDLFNPQSAIRNQQSAVLRMKLSGANNAPAITGESEMGVKSNYFIGNDPQKWHTDVARYERVRYSQVYPGIDMIYYGQQQSLEYDFEVAPGADARQIALEFAGVKRVRIERKTGELVLKTTSGEVRQHKPVAYQEEGGERLKVESRYVVNGKRKVGIEVGQYDRTKRLVIDPVLGYSTYLGGNDYDEGYGIAVDAAGNAYVTGFTSSIDFPTKNQYQIIQGIGDAFVTKIDTNAAGAASLIYSTYLGGSDPTYGDSGNSIAVDSSGYVYVTGVTSSTDFPTLNQFQTYQGTDDAFVTKLDTNASGAESLLYSTYLGADTGGVAQSIAVDSSGHAYVTGFTNSTHFPTKNQYQTDQPGYDAFVMKLDTNASGAESLLYSTYLGGDSYDIALGIAVDSSGYAYVTGGTYSSDFPTKNQYQTDQVYGDAFVTKLDTNASGVASLLYSTYLGGSNKYNGEYGAAIAVDSAGHAYVTGDTFSTDFPTLNQFQTYLGIDDVFVTKLDTNASGEASLLYSTYLGGYNGDYGVGIAVDSAGNVYVTGATYSPDFPVLHPYQTYQDMQGGYDAFVTKLNPNASGVASLLYSTFLGAGDDDGGNAIAVDSAGNAYVTGRTGSRNFPKLNQYQAYQPYVNAFVTKLIKSYTVSGRVTSDGTTGIKGVTITISGSSADSVVTYASGKFSFELAAGGNFTVTPSKSGLTFVPLQQSFNDLQADHTNVNFTLPPTISGHVTLNTAAGAGLAGVTVALTDGAGFTPRTVQTASDGAYSFNNLPTGGNYKLKPSLTNYTFAPTQLVLYNVTANQTDQNFVATLKTYTISGVVKLGATGLAGVTVKLTGPTPSGFTARTVMTSSTGAYSFTNVPANQDYTVTPTKTGYQLTPTNKVLTNLISNQAGVNFAVKVYSITGRVTRTGTTTGISAVTVTLTSPTPAGFAARTVQTSSTGVYSFTTLPAGRNYTIKPTKTGFTFSPTTRSITNLSGNIGAGAATNFTGAGP